MNPRPIVVNTQQETVNAQGRQLQIQAYDQETGIQQFDTLRAARAYIDENPNAQLGGIGENPTERVSALEQYRLVHANGVSAIRQGPYRRNLRRNQQRANISPRNQIFNTPSWVKTFEKVPGATVEGSGAPADAEVAATVRMEIPSTGRSFSYTQYTTADEAGNFEMTVPYSTTGYENFGPENGYTNVSVQAAGQYRFAASQQAVGSAEVSEAQVLGVDEAPVQVELSEPPQISRQSVQATG
ncbi:MAG: hypothetical protein J07HN6_01910 [Halonotius sp. J07HN6]|nr:MAG: hypothetical protein J07HN6_01910 [Halonotius sp. J07HN6]